MHITENESGQILIAGTLEIGAAEELRDALRDYLERAATPALDLSQVDGIDAAALQLLCSARKSAEHGGKLLHVCRISAPVRQKSEVLGLSLADFGAASARESSADGI